MLLDIGHADVNLATKHGNTPLMLAAMQGDKEMIDLLLEHNAEVFGRKNNWEEDVVKVAQLQGHSNLAVYLQDAGLKQQQKSLNLNLLGGLKRL